MKSVRIEREVDFSRIEKKWQEKWERAKIFEAKEDKKKEKYYVLEMFPYPSGSGLHMGHAFNYTVGDIFARFMRMQDFNVLYPMGYDSFGLPAENAAIKNNVHPKKFTEEAIKNFIKQQKSLGLSYDWSRMIKTSDKEYYKWNQYFFLKFFEKGLAYRKEANVNWCGKCNSVLANEQVHNGKCWIHKDTEVEIKQLKQWFIRITGYAEELLREIQKLDWPERIKIMQRNWIGKSEGSEVDFEIENKKNNFVLLHGFTGSPDKNFFPWLKKELENKGNKVFAPKLPNTNNPNINEQVEHVLKNVKFNENSVLLGHSLGSIVALKVVESLNKPVKKLVLAAGFIDPTLVSEEKPYKKIFDWKFDFEKIKRNAKEIIILRDLYDDSVHKLQAGRLKEKIGGEIIDFEAKEAHICGKQEPVVLNYCLEKWPVFTTRADTLFGVTFLVVSAQHPKLMGLVSEKQKKEVEKFLKKTKSTKQEEIDKMEKEGVFTGSYAIHPLTKEKIPIYAGNFVIAEYGSGMVMGVPAHDQRDFEFAKKYKLPVKQVVQEENKIIVIEKSLEPAFYKKIEEFGRVAKKNGLVYIYTDKINDVFELAKINFIDFPWYIHSEGNIKKIMFHSEKEDKIFDWSNKQELKNTKEYGLKIGIKREQLDFDEIREAYEGFGVLVNSQDFYGLFSDEAKEHIAIALQEKGLGRKSMQYKLRDWLISRQRYWGTPIPIIYCSDCGIVPVPEKELPVELPENVKFGKGNPLETNEKFVNVKCLKCGKKARRETDTMDTFVDSSWYYLRYLDNKNDKKPFAPDKAKYWMPINQYIGGAEHAVMHLIYARFFTKVLRDLGFVKINEPFPKLFNQGMIHGEDGFVMSKSRGNVIDPIDISSRYGADTLRLFLISVASPDKDIVWSKSGVEGSRKFLRKVWDYFENIKFGKISERAEHKINKTIKAVGDEIRYFRYNFAVIKIREMFEFMISEREISKEYLEKTIKILSPFCPHMAEELWEKIGGGGFVSLEKWPEFDEGKIKEEFDKAEEIMEKTISDVKNILKLMKEKQGKEGEKIYLYVLPQEKELYDAKDIGSKTGKEVKIFAVNDKSKYDPQGKAQKSRAGKPAIFVE
ncbi:class I tRNA ligase family protein [Candidatus Pacearchaeota archaeon]|nr:class I tRNA ligase family protein [Candidatus Pacearchaeota archaeon]